MPSITAPHERQTCSKCLYSSSHPFGIYYDSSGVCSGCKTHQEKYSLDWECRAATLEKLVTPYRSTSKKTWDCIIPITGGGDSYFTVHYVKNILNMNPLLVSYNNLYNSELGFRNIANLRTTFDCDFFQFIPSPSNVRKITKFTLNNYLNIYWHSIAGQTVYPVQMAAKTGIPLIIWGSHQGIEQVGMFSHLDEVEMSRWYRKNHDLFGLEAEDLYEKHPELRHFQLECYFYPKFDIIKKVGIRGIYLSNYIPWNPMKQNHDMSEKYGYIGSKNKRTFDIYDVPEQMFYYGFHDYSKQLKLGYAKVTDQLSREIRHGNISRAAAIKLNKHYLSQKPEGIGTFCDWLEIKQESLDFLSSRFSDDLKKLTWKHDKSKIQNFDKIYPALIDIEHSRLPKIVDRGHR